MKLSQFLTFSTLLTFYNSMEMVTSMEIYGNELSMNVSSFMGSLMLPIPTNAKILYLTTKDESVKNVVIWESSKSWLKSCTLQIGKNLILLRFAYDDKFYYDNYEKIQFRVSSENGYFKYPIRSFDCSKEKALGLGLGISVLILGFIVLCFLRRICCR